MEQDRLIQELQPAIGAMVSFWKEWFQPNKNAQRGTFERTSDNLLRPDGNAQAAFSLANAAAFALLGRERLPLLSSEQLEQFGQALHLSIETMIRQADLRKGNKYLPGTGKREFVWRFGLDYDLEGMDAHGRHSINYRDVPLAHAAEALGIDPRILKLSLPWQTWTEVRYGLAVPRAIALEQGNKRVLSPVWMITASQHVIDAWNRSSLRPETEEVESIQEIRAEQTWMRVSLGHIHYKIRSGALVGRQTYIAVVDEPTEEDKTIQQATYVRRSTLTGNDLPDLLVMVADQFPTFIPFLESVSWEALGQR